MDLIGVLYRTYYMEDYIKTENGLINTQQKDAFHLNMFE